MVVVIIGRWSMIDVFMISILVAVVRYGALANIKALPGVACFAAVVVLTIFAADLFDPPTTSFAATGALTVSRHSHTSTLLPSVAYWMISPAPSWPAVPRVTSPAAAVSRNRLAAIASKQGSVPTARCAWRIRGCGKSGRWTILSLPHRTWPTASVHTRAPRKSHAAPVPLSSCVQPPENLGFG